MVDEFDFEEPTPPFGDDDLPVSSSPAKSRGGNGNSSSSCGGSSTVGSSAKGKKAKSPFCVVPDCSKDKKGQQFCYYHTGKLESYKGTLNDKKCCPTDARKQAELTKLKEDDYAIECVLWAENHLLGGVGKLKAAAVAKFEGKYGKTSESASGQLTEPYEKEEWIRDRINKVGWPREVCLGKWAVHEASNAERDYCGEKQQLRLWLPQKEYKRNETIKFKEEASVETSSVLSNPRSADIEQLRRHALSVDAEGLQHRFFRDDASHQS